MEKAFEAMMTKVLADADVSDATLTEVRDMIDETSSQVEMDDSAKALRNACDEVLHTRKELLTLIPEILLNQASLDKRLTALEAANDDEPEEAEGSGVSWRQIRGRR